MIERDDKHERHVLRVGRLRVEMLINSKGEIALNFMPKFPSTKEQFDQFFKRFQPWRNEIMLAWSLKHNKLTTLTDKFADGSTRVTVFDRGRLFVKDFKKPSSSFSRMLERFASIRRKFSLFS